MSYSEAEKNSIISTVIKITINAATKTKTGFAPDILIEPAVQKAYELIEKYQDEPDFDIWRKGRLDLYVNHIIRNLMIQNYYDYKLSEENIEAVSALIEAEAMLNDDDTDADLLKYFDYTPEELIRLRILAKYLNGIDREATYREFAQKYKISDL